MRVEERIVAVAFSCSAERDPQIIEWVRSRGSDVKIDERLPGDGFVFEFDCGWRGRASR